MAKSIKDMMAEVKNSHNIERINEDTTRFIMYNGQVRDVIQKTIEREFKLPETIKELSGRIVPINIIEKIINTLAAVYQSPAVRTPKDKDINDQELISLYEESLKINQKMKFANRYFKLHKHTVIEPFLDYEGVPRMRAMPSQTYTPINDDPVQPERMTALVKHIRVDADASKSRFQIWTDEDFLIVDGEGRVMQEDMNALDNSEGVNPFGVIPFTYIPESDDGRLIPIPDDDLVNMAITIPLLLTDLAFASKYQLWSILAVTGVTNENLSFNPNTIMSLPPGADVKVIKPELDSDKALSMVEQLMGLLLTTKNLSVGEISGRMTTRSAASGVSVMLDKAVTTEDRKDQQAFFSDAEKDFWDKFAHKILPVWVKSGQINPKYSGAFSADFELSIRFADPKPFVGDRETLELESMKLADGLTTKDMSLQVVHPEMDADQVKMLKEEINKEKKERAQDMMATMQKASNAPVPPVQKQEEDDKE